MFQRRDSHRPSIDLIANFKKSFPNLIHADIVEQPLATPVATSIEKGSDDFMSFDPNLFGHLEEESEQLTTPGGTVLPPPTSQARSDSLHYNYLDFSSPWHQSPDSTGFFPSQFQYQWPPLNQQRFPTPSSRSLSVPSSTQYQQPAYLSLQDVQLQPQYQHGQFEFPNYQQFANQASGLASFGVQHGGQLQLGSSQSRPQRPSTSVTRDSLQSSDFRFSVSLLNGTAMVKDNDIPVSYLNKRQSYKIVIRDTRPERHSQMPTTYRTFIRVSFHEEKQRSRPDQHWQLWKEGRGMNEAQQHGGKLQAIEYVPQSQTSGQHSSVHLEKESFDGFAVTWTTPNGLTPQCEVHFRCNFLSTDFSRSKGVKGIPVRLCAKNEVVGFSTAMGPPPSSPEICYCKIKLFRDHGAERKLTNDEAAVKRLINKTEEQLKQSQPESGEVTSFTASGKRRGSDLSQTEGRASKLPRVKRASSISSDDSSQVQESNDGDLSHKLANLTRLLRSRQDSTLFFLRGDDLDDPDLHPVSIGDNLNELVPQSSPEMKREDRTDAHAVEASSALSPHATHHAVSPQLGRSNLQLPTPITSQHPSSEWTPSLKAESSANDSSHNQHTSESPVSRRVNAKRIETQTGSVIEAVDIDPVYQPPTGPALKPGEYIPKLYLSIKANSSTPVACFYVRFRMSGLQAQDRYYRAIYLYQRTLTAFLNELTKKAGIHAMEVIETLYKPINDKRGVEIQVDDDVINHLPEAQDILAEFLPIDSEQGTNQRAMSLRTHSQSRGRQRYTLVLTY